MPDEADIANDTAELILQEARRQQRAIQQLPTSLTHCLYCHEPLKTTARFCDTDCQADYESETHLKNKLFHPSHQPQPFWHQKTNHSLPPTGLCHYCYLCVPGDKLFCNLICHDAYES